MDRLSFSFDQMQKRRRGWGSDRNRFSMMMDKFTINMTNIRSILPKIWHKNKRGDGGERFFQLARFLHNYG